MGKRITSLCNCKPFCIELFKITILILFSKFLKITLIKEISLPYYLHMLTPYFLFMCSCFYCMHKCNFGFFSCSFFYSESRVASFHLYDSLELNFFSFLEYLP